MNFQPVGKIQIFYFYHFPLSLSGWKFTTYSQNLLFDDFFVNQVFIADHRMYRNSRNFQYSLTTKSVQKKGERFIWNFLVLRIYNCEFLFFLFSARLLLRNMPICFCTTAPHISIRMNLYIKSFFTSQENNRYLVVVLLSFNLRSTKFARFYYSEGIVIL